MNKKVLITVKTYPTPSKKYKETVCTAGITEDGQLIRLYPIDYRYKDYDQWYKKYQWVEVKLQKHNKDPRPESFRPIGEIKIIGKPLSTKNKWEERKKYVLSLNKMDMCELELKKQKEISLALIRPKKVLDFFWEKDSNDWDLKQKLILNQLHLFNKNKPLEKVPYKFKYKFLCNDNRCKEHTLSIIDWEIYELYRKMKEKYYNEDLALEKVKKRFLNFMFVDGRDTYFFVGTVLKHGKWLIIGLFYPPK